MTFRQRLMTLLACALCMTGAQASAQQNCTGAPQPILQLDYDSRYLASDDTRSIIDMEAKAERASALKPLDNFLRDLANQHNEFLRADQHEKTAIADCIVGDMAVWANADALSDLGSESVELTVGSRLASFSIILRSVAPHSSRTADLNTLRDWLGRRMSEQMAFWERAPDGARQGNLRAWSALAGAAIADFSDDDVIRGWSAWSVVYVLCSANEDGSLPQEMSRGRLALHYQLHAVASLSVAALMLERSGIPIQDRCNGALQKAARFAINDSADGRQTQAITGFQQSYFDGTDVLEDFQFAWVEAYLELTNDAQVEAFAEARRPLSYSKLGGNQTLLWGQ